MTLNLCSWIVSFTIIIIIVVIINNIIIVISLCSIQHTKELKQNRTLSNGLNEMWHPEILCYMDSLLSY